MTEYIEGELDAFCQRGHFTRLSTHMMMSQIPLEVSPVDSS